MARGAESRSSETPRPLVRRTLYPKPRGWAGAQGSCAADRAPIADPDAPGVLTTPEFPAAGGSGFSASARIFRSMRAKTASSSASSSYLADRLSSSEHLAMGAAALQAGGPVFVVRNALLLAARLRHKPIRRLFPECPVLSKINLHRDFTPSLIGTNWMPVIVLSSPMRELYPNSLVALRSTGPVGVPPRPLHGLFRRQCRRHPAITCPSATVDSPYAILRGT